MATTAEINAAIAKAEKAGRKDLADQLRARLSEASDATPAADPTRIQAAIAKAEAKGRKDLADQLRAALPQAPAAPAAAGPSAPPVGQTEDQMRASRFAQFEEANPGLRGRFTVDNFPGVGEVVFTGGGGGKSGGNRVTVQGYTGSNKADTFGDTAQAMMEGPVAGMQAFAGGLTGGPSPSRDYLAKDPLTGNLPGPVLTGLGVIGDAGGAALSGIGAGLSGAIGLGAEMVPGQGQTDERKLAEDTLGMSMFAVPELAGASSVPARIAATAPRVAEASPVASKVAEAAPKVAEVAAKTPEEVGALTQKAASGGMGAVKAQEELAAQAKINPEAKAAADRLGIDLPADVFSDDDMVKATVGLTRSEVGKEPEALWRRAVKGARDKADEIIAPMKGWI